MPGNNVRIYYTDGASLIIKSTEVDAVDYFRPSSGGGGAWVRFMWHQVLEINVVAQVTFSKAQMPEEVMRRMGSVPRFFHLYSFLRSPLQLPIFSNLVI